MLLSTIEDLQNRGKKLFAMLIDPDKQSLNELESLTDMINQPLGPDFLLVGGSLLFNSVDSVVRILKERTTKPVFLFPGSAMQITANADGILLLSLISGRNADLLIGQHVLAAPALAKSGLEIIPTGYMLIGAHNYTSVQYMSGTMPIPADKTDIAVATAMAGQMLGLRTLYLEAGSGANEPISTKMIAAVRSSTRLPLIVGGGLRSANDVRQAFAAGADIAVVGTSIERNKLLISEIAAVVKEF